MTHPQVAPLFEHASNEGMRICLQLERLFDQIEQRLSHPSADWEQEIIDLLARVCDVLINQPQLKRQLSQMLTQHATTLGQLERFDAINHQQLNTILHQLDNQINALNQIPHNTLCNLIDHPFLNKIRSKFALPGYHYDQAHAILLPFLQLPHQSRQQHILSWCEQLSQLQSIISLLLFLTRQNSQHQTLEASHGFYQQALNPALPVGLLQLQLASNLGIYPEFTCNRHRLTIRFCPMSLEKGSSSPDLDCIPFILTLCRH